MRRIALGIALALLPVVPLVLTRPAPATAQLDATAAEAQFLTLLNATRASNGKAALQRDAGLDGVARNWSAHMSTVFGRNGGVVIDNNAKTDCERSALCHRPDLADATQSVEPAWQAAGENIGTGGEVVGLDAAFNASPGHFANVVGDYNRVGVGVVTVGDRIWITFDFLRGPTQAAAAPAPAPSTNAAPAPSGATQVPRGAVAVHS